MLELLFNDYFNTLFLYGDYLMASRLLARPATPTYDDSDDDETTYIKSARQWCVAGDTFWGAPDSIKSVPPGVYRAIYADNRGPALLKVNISTDDILELPDSVCTDILSDFKTFWTLKDSFDQYGFLHKRGFFLYGPPGSGKTCTIQLMCRHIIEQYGGVILLVNAPTIAAACLQIVRKIEPDRPIVVILEDMDSLVREYGNNEFLSLLDGESQVGGVVFVATTNYPEDLDERFTNRPSRFDVHKEVPVPSDRDRAAFLKAKVQDLSDEEVKSWVALTKGYSIAHLRELIVSVKCFKSDVAESVKRLNKMMENRAKSSDFDNPRKQKVGFGRG